MPITDTDRWPVVPARWFTKTDPGAQRVVRVIVIHTMEAPEKSTTAEDVARYFATTDTKASAHLCIDNDSIVQCVMDRDVAWAAPGCNNDGIQIELAGTAAQTDAQWDDAYSRALLNNGANAVAQYCLKYNVPIRHLSNTELKNGRKGIVGHVQVSTVYKKSDHQDPGKSFPWARFLEQVSAFYEARKLRHA